MSRTAFPFVAADISALARALQRELEPLDTTPSHLQMLNMLVRATGYRNFQHFRAQHTARTRLAYPPAAPEPVNYKLVERVAGHFDSAGRLIRWPAKSSQQTLCLWVMWSRFPAGVVMTEKQVNALLNDHHLFGDPATLRRIMCGQGMLTRTVDGTQYRRIEQRPPPEAVALIAHLSGRPTGESPVER